MIAGRIEFVPEPPRFERADVDIWIEDTTYADAAAVEIFHTRLTSVSYDSAAGGLPFTLDYTPTHEPGRTYSFGVLVDVDGDGRPSRGDYISFEAVRVPVDGSEARVRVRRID